MNNGFYLQIENEQKGPYTLTQLQGMWQSGRLTMADLFWQEGNPDWQPLSYITELLEPLEKAAPAAYMLPRKNSKSRLLYIVLGLFLGSLGGHNWYVGRHQSASYQLCLTLAAIGGWAFLAFVTVDGDQILLEYTTIVLPILLALWVFAELIFNRHDGDGNLMA